MAEFLVPDIPKAVPQKSQRSVCGWLGRFLLKRMGWRITGRFPEESKVVLAVAPHTSNWDFVIAMLGVMATGIKISYLMKKEAFVWPLSRLYIWLGGVPLDRKLPQGTVEQLQMQFRQTDKLWVAITPEGTRKKVAHYKAGFIRIAQEAGVPIFIVAFDYPSKRLILDRIWPLAQDAVTEAEAIRRYVRDNYRGRFPEKQ